MHIGGQRSSSASHRITTSYCDTLDRVIFLFIVLYCIVLCCIGLHRTDWSWFMSCFVVWVRGLFRTKISLEKAPSSVLLDTRFHASSSRLVERLTPCF